MKGKGWGKSSGKGEYVLEGKERRDMDGCNREEKERKRKKKMFSFLNATQFSLFSIIFQRIFISIF